MTELSHEQLTWTLRFFHPEKSYPILTEAMLATMFETSLEIYRQIKAECAAATRQAAEELLVEPEFAARVERLPFAPRSTIVGMGDSITDDWQSWIEILRSLLSIRRPNDQIRVVNAGMSGYTTTELFGIGFYNVAAEKPDWIICMAGTNDGRKYGEKPLKVEVSPEETEKNLAQLRDFGATRTSAQWVWMTPTPVIPEMMRAHWFMGAPTQLTVWMNEDLAPVVDIVRRQKDQVVDLQKAFGNPPKPEYLLDGLHPSLTGQKLIARALVEQLS